MVLELCKSANIKSAYYKRPWLVYPQQRLEKYDMPRDSPVCAALLKLS